MSLLKPDLCIIGAGSGGLSVAAAAAAFGVPVILIEQGQMGGECLNAGCVPSKALIAAADYAAAMMNAEGFGTASVAPQVHMGRVRDHIRQTIAALAPTDSAERFAALGVQVIRAPARFVDRKTIDAGGQLIQPRRIVLATGSRPAVPAIPGLDEVPFLTTETVFALSRKLSHLIVIGGGPAGVELAQAHRRLGAQVTLVEAGRLLPREDEEAVAVVRRALLADGVVVHEQTQLRRVAASGRSGVVATLHAGEGEWQIAGSELLIAAGRAPAHQDLALEAAGIKTDAQGIIVNAALKTSNRRVYAIGDCASGAARDLRSTHAATHQAGLVIRSALFRLPARLDASLAPRVVYTDPELASVGLSEDEARAAHAGVQTLRWPFSDNDRATAERRREGLIKVMADKKGRILGASIAGRHAGELIAPWTLALMKGLTLKDMAGVIMPYPTLSEASRRVAVSAFVPLTASPFLRRLIRLLRRLG